MAGRGLCRVRKAIHSDEQARLCALLRSLREDTGLRQVDVAESLGVAQSVVSKWENGQRRVDLVELEQICGLYGVTLTALVEMLKPPGRSKVRRRVRRTTE